MLRSIIAVSVIFIAVLNAAHAEDAATALRDRLEKIKSLSASFQQTLYDEAGEVLQQSQGTARLKRPGHLFWATESPYEALMVADNKTLWRHDIDLEQVTRQPLDKSLSQTPALLLSGEVAHIEQSFVVREEGQGTAQSTFVLEPKAADSLVRQLQFTFKAGEISGMRIVDDLQQRTDIVFSDVVLNGRIDDSVFKFDIPPGVDVISND